MKPRWICTRMIREKSGDHYHKFTTQSAKHGGDSLIAWASMAERGTGWILRYKELYCLLTFRQVLKKIWTALHSLDG